MLVYLVGNRVDLGEDLRQVSKEDAIKSMKEKGLNNFFETSAKTGFNVKALFNSLIKHMYLHHKQKLDQYVSFFISFSII